LIDMRPSLSAAVRAEERHRRCCAAPLSTVTPRVMLRSDLYARRRQRSDDVRADRLARVLHVETGEAPVTVTVSCSSPTLIDGNRQRRRAGQLDALRFTVAKPVSETVNV
jgi:hypothetical protein